MARTVAAPGRTNRRFLLIAILFAALSGALMYAWMASQGGDDSGGGAAGAGSQQVVVARQAIQERTLITSDMLQIKSVSTNAVVTGAFTDIDSVAGKVTKLPIEANVPGAARDGQARSSGSSTKAPPHSCSDRSQWTGLA